jgi:alkanesulfonate monooxygenase SsuD/methylene tetrahydromethanopterin reductase-like flavin-dependent oxidoreductase (luciferase family)
MEFGLFSNNRRPDIEWGTGWDQDVAEIVTADECGFTEAWVSEHEVPAELIISKAAPLTKRIKLGPAVRPLGYYHPVQIVLDANGTDHITHGRYMLGVGSGFLPQKYQWRGRDIKDAQEMMVESIDLILKLWNATGPVDHDGKYWQGRNINIPIKPVQKPHPPIGLSVANSTDTAALVGRYGFQMLTPDFTSARKLKWLNDARLEAMDKAGRTPRRSDLRACRVVYVGETDKSARDDMRESYEKIIKWEIEFTPHHQRDRIPEGGSFDDITFDYLIDDAHNLFVGSADTVRQMIEDYYKEVGGFGVLMFHCGRPYATPEKFANSMRLFARDVAPKLRHLKADAPEKAVA